MVLETYIEKTIVGRLSEGMDLLESLKKIVEKHGIRGGEISLIGSLKRVRVGYYSRDEGKYIVKEGEGFFELVSCIGNISWRDGEPVIHIHMAAASLGGEVYLGHVLEGNIVDATVEYVIHVFKDKIERSYDKDTGLYQLKV